MRDVQKSGCGKSQVSAARFVAWRRKEAWGTTLPLARVLGGWRSAGRSGQRLPLGLETEGGASGRRFQPPDAAGSAFGVLPGAQGSPFLEIGPRQVGVGDVRARAGMEQAARVVPGLGIRAYAYGGAGALRGSRRIAVTEAPRVCCAPTQTPGHAFYRPCPMPSRITRTPARVHLLDGMHTGPQGPNAASGNPLGRLPAPIEKDHRRFKAGSGCAYRATEPAA